MLAACALRELEPFDTETRSAKQNVVEAIEARRRAARQHAGGLPQVLRPPGGDRRLPGRRAGRGAGRARDVALKTGGRHDAGGGDGAVAAALALEEARGVEVAVLARVLRACDLESRMEADISVRQATIHDLELVVPLFDAYRQFYRQTSDLDLARRFISERFEHNQSVIFLALDTSGAAVGFTQLFPWFSIRAAKRAFILNDLFVVPEARRKGVGALLLDAAAAYARASARCSCGFPRR